MARDTMGLDAPAAQDEFAWLKTVKVGDVRRGDLFPALSVGVEWTCTKVGTVAWEFEGCFFGQPLCVVLIVASEGLLTLTVKE